MNDKNMSDYKSLTDEVITLLEAESPKDENGKREETYSETIMRLIRKAGSPETKRLIKKAN